MSPVLLAVSVTLVEARELLVLLGYQNPTELIRQVQWGKDRKYVVGLWIQDELILDINNQYCEVGIQESNKIVMVVLV